jgi:hypothetical protein
VDPDAFLATDVFRRALWTPGATDPAHFAAVDRLWDDLLTRSPRAPMFRLVRDGATLPSSSYCRRAGVGHRDLDDVIQPNRVVELHQCGATVVLQGLQLTDPHLGRCTNNLALVFDHPVQVNAYLTPRAAKGLELHFDFHDVFVVQLAGRKRWRVWEPLERTELPVRGGPATPMPTFAELGAPALDLTLVAGDCLYLPRGFPHAAEAVDSPSSHLTIGVMAVTWHKAVRAAVDAALVDPDLRRSLAPGALAVPAGPADDLDLRSVLAQLEPERLRPWLAAEIWRRQPATRLRPVEPPAEELTTVRVTPGPLLWLYPEGDRAALGLGDRRVTMPAEAQSLLAAVLAAPDHFDAVHWDGELDHDSRAVVLARLAAEGVVAAV